MDELQLSDLFSEMSELRRSVLKERDQILSGWAPWLGDGTYASSAANFAGYLALRHNDLRLQQERLMRAGLSSLGRAESRVLPTLDAVVGLLAAATQGTPWTSVSDDEFRAGERHIAARADKLLGPVSRDSPIRLLVSLPSEAADEPEFLLRLAKAGVEAVRINCAHDNEAVWLRMIDNVDRAAAVTGLRMKIMMDLAGPKIRTGRIRDQKGLHRVADGTYLAITSPDVFMTRRTVCLPSNAPYPTRFRLPRRGTAS